VHLEDQVIPKRCGHLAGKQLIPVEDGVPALGRWQGIFFCEFDGPRERLVYISVLS
jgi:thiamine phosphate synthase YjbQ (UPF0047 family)